MTIVIAFYGSEFRTFKDCYNLMVRPFWRKAFPNLVSGLALWFQIAFGEQ